MIKDRIGRHEVLLPINRNFKKFVIYKALLKIKTQEILRFFFASDEKNKTFQRARNGAHCPITY